MERLKKAYSPNQMTMSGLHRTRMFGQKTRMEAGLTMVMLGAIQAQESQMEDGARTDDKMTLEANQTPKSVRDKIVIQMTHPTLHPDEITEQLDWDPSVTWIAGASRLTARGVPRGGVYPIMYWCGSERREDQKAFFNHLSEIVEHVEERRSFIVNFIQSGGTLGLTLELPGDCHACDLLHAREFVRMARLGIDFGIEVFPDFGDGVGPARGQVAGFAPGGDQVGRWCKQGASENYEKNDCGEMRYEIRLSLHHPTVPALVVTEQLEWTPVSVEEDCGLDHHWVGVEGRQQYRLFFSHFMDLIAHLEERQDFVSEYLGSGGTAAFTVIVPGSCNIGDVLKAESSMRVGQLGIDLKLEVLPGEVQARSVE